MKAVSGKRFIRLVEERGWVLKRISGSHHIFTKQGRDETLVIPVHGNHPLKIGLQAALMKIVGLTSDDL